MTKVLITGVAGFVGSNLADRLLAEGGFEVLGIDNLAYGVREQVPAGAAFHELDVRSPDIGPVFGGVDYVFHLAAKNCIADCQEDPVETADINVRGTVNVFEAARRAGVKKVIYAESSAMYEGSAVLPTPEAEVKPESFYAVSKWATMGFAKAYSRFHGLKTTALRYFCVYGPRQDYRRSIPPVMSAFIIKLRRDESPVIYGSGEKRRDFIHVDDVNDFHLLCMNDPRTDGKDFNLGSAVSHSVREIYEITARLLGKSKPPVHKNDLPGEARETLADISRARTLGWSPKVGLEDGLRGMISYIEAEAAAGRIAQ